MNYQDKTTAEQLIKNYKPDFRFASGFESAQEVLELLEAKEFGKVIPYPHTEMNSVLKGIFPGSFVVIGSDYGGGKSDLVGEIAIHACFHKKRVLYFDFENDDGDFVMRQTCKEYTRRTKKPFTTADFRMTDIDKDAHIEELVECVGIVADRIKDMRIFKNDSIPNINDFVEKLREVRDVDLICIDHLHYFSSDDDKSSIEQLSKIMRELRRLTKIEKIPVILVSHLTKRDKKKLPTASDFYGTSNIAKEAKTCILLHRDDEGVSSMIIDKNREGGSTKILNYTWNEKRAGIEFVGDYKKTF